jgi:hypothetical protein
MKEEIPLENTLIGTCTCETSTLEDTLIEKPLEIENSDEIFRKLTCGTYEYNSQIMKEDPTMLEVWKNIELFTTMKKDEQRDTIYTMIVSFFHKKSITEVML